MDKASILIVEDEMIVALDVQSRLKGLGYTVPAAISRGEEAVRRALELRPDLILMDVQLKGTMDGIEAAQHIRAQLDVPVIYLTARADSDTLERAKITQPFGYIVKPFEERELHTTIEMALYKHEMDAALRARAIELEQKNHELSVINRLITASANDLEPETLLDTACRELAQVLGLYRAAAVLFDKEKMVVRVVAEYKANGRPPLLNAAIPVAGWALFQDLLALNEPLVVSDTQSDPRFLPLLDLMRQRGTRSLLVLPLFVQGELAGALGLEADEPDRFSPDQARLSWSVASQLAGALARVWLNEERKRLSAATEQAAESVIITDTQGTIVYVNPAFERITGYGRAEAIGQNPRILWSGKQDAAFYADLWATLKAGDVWQGRLVNKKKNGALYTVEATITPVCSEYKTSDGNDTVVNYVSVQRDVTRELQLEEQYRHALKMEAVGQLAAGIAHDFNNMLTTINGFALLAKRQLPADNPHHIFMDKIIHSGQRAADLTRQLLTFSRKQVTKPKVFDLNDIVSHTRDMLRRTIGEHIELPTILSPNLWSVKADPAQMERVIVNLAVNARDAMPDGGRLTLETANVVLDEAEASFDLEAQPGEYVTLSISDTGVGMSDEVKAHLFEPFFTTKAVDRGTGLGLATVYGIVKKSGGHIRVQSTEGQGTTFQIYLPRSREAVSPSVGPQLQMAGAHSGSETILMAEDNAEVRKLACRVLEHQGYDLLVAEDGQQAWQIAGRHEGPIHLLLTDVMMPRMNGKVLAERLTETRPDLKVLFMSGYANDIIGRHGVLESDVAFLHKPFTPTELVRKVRAVLDD